MQNIEFKAELRDVSAARALCGLLGAMYIGRVQQKDTYYRMPDGRLKRREAEHEPTEWIFYHRADSLKPRLSSYTILTDEQARRRWGIASLRPWLEVDKMRELWMLENIRIHLDELPAIGRFIEFEALVTAKTPVDECHRRISELRERFAETMGEPISVSYSDLMAQEIDDSRLPPSRE